MKHSRGMRLNQTHPVKDEIDKGHFPDIFVEAVASTKEVVGNQDKLTPVELQQRPAASIHIAARRQAREKPL